MGLVTPGILLRWFVLELFERAMPWFKHLTPMGRLRAIRDEQPKPRCDICGSVTKAQRDDRCKGACTP